MLFCRQSVGTSQGGKLINCTAIRAWGRPPAARARLGEAEEEESAVERRLTAKRRRRLLSTKIAKDDGGGGGSGGGGGGGGGGRRHQQLQEETADNEKKNVDGVGKTLQIQQDSVGHLQQEHDEVVVLK